MTNQPPLAPGEILNNYIKRLGLSQHALSVRAVLTVTRINTIIHGTRGITADTAARLAKFFEALPSSATPEGQRPSDPMWWLEIQAAYDLHQIGKSEKWREAIPRFRPYASSELKSELKETAQTHA